MFITLVVFCVVACVALALVGMIGGGGGASGEQLTRERMARRESKQAQAAPGNVTPLPAAGPVAAERDDAAA